jgi:putative membrane protein
LFVIFGIVILATIAIIIGSTIYFGLTLGHALLFTPHPFFFPFFGLGFLIFGIIIVGLFMGLIFRPFRRRGYYYRGWYQYDNAMDSLRQRYARGEITRDQFEQMAGDLEKHH